MSANTQEIPLNIECFMEDKDVTGKMCRADFEKLAASFLSRVETAMQAVLQSSSKQPMFATKQTYLLYHFSTYVVQAVVLRIFFWQKLQ